MAKLAKRVVETAELQSRDYVIWDDELPGLACACSCVSAATSFSSALRTLASLHHRSSLRMDARARQGSPIQLGRVAQGDNPAEERQLDHKAITVKELCELYLKDLAAGLVLGKRGHPKR